MMTDSMISSLDKNLNMSSLSGITLIEFNEQQKANIAAALQAVSDQMMPGTNCCLSALRSFDNNHCNTNMMESISGEKKSKIDIVKHFPNFSNEKHSNQVHLTHNFSPYNNLIKEEPQLQENMFLFPTATNEEINIVIDIDNIAAEEVLFVQETNDDKCSVKDDADKNEGSVIGKENDTGKEGIIQQMNGNRCSGEDDANNSQDYVMYMENNAEEEVIVIRINDNECSDKDDVNNGQDSDYETTATIDYSKFIDYSCPQCNQICGSLAKWKSHTKEHQVDTSAWFKLRTTTNKNGKLISQCQICMEELNINSQFNQLQAHFIKHLPYNEYLKCKICYQKFKQIYNIKDHIRNFHRKTCRQYQKAQSEIDMQLIEIYCPICQQLQLDRNCLWKHLEEIHDYAEQIRSKISEEEKHVYTCKVCKQKLRQNSIKNHMLCHEKYKSFKCTLCKKESAIIGNAVSHKRIIHLRNKMDKPFKCSYCGEYFKNLYLRRKHISGLHKDVLPKCSVCKKVFYSISYLLDHMKLTNHFDLTSSDLS